MIFAVFDSSPLTVCINCRLLHLYELILRLLFCSKKSYMLLLTVMPYFAESHFAESQFAKLTLTVTPNPNRHSNGNIFYAHFVDTHKKVVSH